MWRDGGRIRGDRERGRREGIIKEGEGWGGEGDKDKGVGRGGG